MSSVFAGPTSNGFIGGAKYGVSPPTGSSGTLAPANTNVGAPAGGVAPGTINTARNNSGSNIRIPYARVVPVPTESTSLPANDKAMDTFKDANARMMTTTIVLESEALTAGRIAFIRGKITSLVAAAATLPNHAHLSNMNAQHFTVPRSMGHGVDRMQRLASFEYMARYFAVVLRRVTIQLNTQMGDNAANTQRTGLPKSGILQTYAPNVQNAATVSNIGDVAQTAAAAVAAASGGTRAGWANPGTAGTRKRMGVFARDIHPFLRGKSLESDLKDCITGGRNAKGQKHLSRSLGDEMAFAWLGHIMATKGIFDWTPDGVVLSKDHAGPDDQSDRGYDTRLGQLFNMVIQGPAIVTNFVGDYKLKTLPGDKVFVCIVCDVHFDKAALPAGGDYAKMVDADVSSTEIQNAAAERDLLLNTFDFPTFLRKSSRGFRQRNADNDANDPKDDFLHNFRLRLSTSSEMINDSGVNVAAWEAGSLDQGDDAAGTGRTTAQLQATFKDAQDEVFPEDIAADNALKVLEKDLGEKQAVFDATPGTDPNIATITAERQAAEDALNAKRGELSGVPTRPGRRTADSKTRVKTLADAREALAKRLQAESNRPSGNDRMGLRLGNTMGEYIVGAWCIGTVTDAAASRAALPGQFATKSDPSTYALNVYTKVEWWTGDKLYRNFCDVEKRFKTRYMAQTTSSPILQYSKPASQRSAPNDITGFR